MRKKRLLKKRKLELKKLLLIYKRKIYRQKKLISLNQEKKAFQAAKDIAPSTIILLIRSYNRPEYLEKTLQSVLDADINLCVKRYIYDDGSTDERTINLLSNDHYVNVKDKEFIVIRDVNQGCQQSYISALNYIKNDNNISNYLICTLDNDVVVKPNFISTIIQGYFYSFIKYKTFNLLLTAFNPTNAHVSMIKDWGFIYRKQSCGGVNFIFHIDFMNFIIEYWNIQEDWGVVNGMNKADFPICCLKKSVVNHCGNFGMNSHDMQYDRDDNF